MSGSTVNAEETCALRIAVSWPARIHLSTSVAELISLGYMWSRSDDVTIRDGLLSFRRDTEYPDIRDENVTFPAYTVGMFPGMSPRATETTWRHEVFVRRAIDVLSLGQ